MAADTQPSTTTEEASQTTTAQEPMEPWTKPELESALAHLERLQDQIDHLRSAIPDLVRPLHARGDGSTPRTKADVLVDVRKTAIQRAEGLRAFSDAWNGEETKRVLERARESEGRDGELGRCEEVPRWGWVERVEGRMDEGS